MLSLYLMYLCFNLRAFPFYTVSRKDRNRDSCKFIFAQDALQNMMVFIAN